MKVIKLGRKQKGWATRYVCTGNGNGGGGCRATLLVEAADVYQTESNHYDGSTDTYVTFSCGACGVATDIADCPVKPLPRAVNRRTHPQGRKARR